MFRRRPSNGFLLVSHPYGNLRQTRCKLQSRRPPRGHRCDTLEHGPFTPYTLEDLYHSRRKEFADGREIKIRELEQEPSFGLLSFIHRVRVVWSFILNFNDRRHPQTTRKNSRWRLRHDGDLKGRNRDTDDTVNSPRGVCGLGVRTKVVSGRGSGK